METFLFLLELAGTVAFAVSGAVLGIEKHMDIFGVGLLGITTAVGCCILRDLRVREIDARTRAVADRLHHGLIPLRRRDGGVCRSFGLCRRLLPAGRQQQRRCAQQAAKNSFHARTSRHFLQTVYTKKFGIANFAASAILSEMDAVRCRRESAAAAEGVTLSGKRTGG